MKRHLILLVLLMNFVLYLKAQKPVSESMTIDGSEMSTENYPKGCLVTTLKNLTLTGEWNTSRLAILKSAIHPDGNVISGHNYSLQTVNMENINFEEPYVSFEYLFRNCENLETIIFPTNIIEQPVDFNNTFFNCSKLNYIDISQFKYIDKLCVSFAYCLELSQIKFNESFQEENVDIHAAFLNCLRLSSINLSRFKNISDMDGVFCYCSSLRDVQFSKSLQSSEVTMNYSFHECHKLSSVDFSRFCNISVMSETFRNCIKLTDIRFAHSSQETSVCFNLAFYNCSNLSSVDISRFKNITNLNGTFKHCTKLESVKISSFGDNTYHTFFCFDKNNRNCVKYLYRNITIPTNWKNCIIIDNQSI